MKRYVAGFMFSFDLRWVALIEKRRPDWQAGKCNAVGGSIEDGETPAEAQRREANEEMGVDTDAWVHFAALSDSRGWTVDFFYYWSTPGVTPVTRTDEPVKFYDVDDVRHDKMPLIGNIPWLLQMALAHVTGKDKTQLFEIKEHAPTELQEVSRA